MKQVEATILGQSYALACPPGGELLLREAVAIVDREMSAIRDAGKVKARERMAVLAALNLAYQRAEQSAATAAAPAPAAALAATPEPSSAPTSAPTSAITRVSADEAGSLDVDALIRRIDEALGNDGRLL